MNNWIGPTVKHEWILPYIYCNFFRFVKITTAYHLCRYSLHILLIKSSIADPMPSYWFNIQKKSLKSYKCWPYVQVCHNATLHIKFCEKEVFYLRRHHCQKKDVLRWWSCKVVKADHWPPFKMFYIILLTLITILLLLLPILVVSLDLGTFLYYLFTCGLSAATQMNIKESSKLVFKLWLSSALNA